MFQQTHLLFRVWMVWDLSGPRRSRRDGDPHTRQDCHLHRVLPIYLLPSPASHSRFVSRQSTFPPAKGLEAAPCYQAARAYFVQGLKITTCPKVWFQDNPAEAKCSRFG